MTTRNTIMHAASLAWLQYSVNHNKAACAVVHYAPSKYLTLRVGMCYCPYIVQSLTGFYFYAFYFYGRRSGAVPCV